jgi:hypothetical protein
LARGRSRSYCRTWARLCSVEHPAEHLVRQQLDALGEHAKNKSIYKMDNLPSVVLSETQPLCEFRKFSGSIFGQILARLTRPQLLMVLDQAVRMMIRSISQTTSNGGLFSVLMYAEAMSPAAESHSARRACSFGLSRRAGKWRIVSPIGQRQPAHL